MTFASVLGQHPSSRMIRSRRWFLLASAFALTLCYLLIRINVSLNLKHLLHVLKNEPFKSFQGEEKTSLKEEMLNPGWNYETFFAVTY